MGISSSYINNPDYQFLKFENYASDVAHDTEGEEIVFSNMSSDYCVGIVDIINSTKISASLPDAKLATYYSVFLNSMSFIVRGFGAMVVKNIGDCLLYYFPDTSNSSRKYSFMKCLECCLAMVEAHSEINEKLKAEKIPSLNYRISVDFGRVTLAKASNSSVIDIFGAPVNMCSKINTSAAPNSVVIGGDLHNIVRNLPDYHFVPIHSCTIGLKLQYPVYAVRRRIS